MRISSLYRSLYGGILTAAAITALAGTAEAGPLNDNHVVRSKSGDVVRSMGFGTCVRTQWEAEGDACAPKQVAAAPRPAPVTRTVLSTAEKTVYFDFDSIALTAQARENLNNVAAKLRAARDVRSADIVGYADRKGSVSYNERLSKRRAETVKNYLAEQGYLNTRVAKVRGLGESRPVTNCSTSMTRDQEIACLSPDRRVEVEIQYLNAHPTR